MLEGQEVQKIPENITSDGARMQVYICGSHVSNITVDWHSQGRR